MGSPRTRHYKDAWYKNPATAHVTGRFKTVNGSDPTVTVGAGYTVARSAEGKWTLTLDQTYPELLCATGGAMLAAAAADGGDLTVHFDPIAANTAVSTVVVYLSADGSDADTPDAWVNFNLVFRTGSLTK